MFSLFLKLAQSLKNAYLLEIDLFKKICSTALKIIEKLCFNKKVY